MSIIIVQGLYKNSCTAGPRPHKIIFDRNCIKKKLSNNKWTILKKTKWVVYPLILKYIENEMNCYLYPGPNCVLPGTLNHQGMCTFDISILFQDSIQKWWF